LRRLLCSHARIDAPSLGRGVGCGRPPEREGLPFACAAGLSVEMTGSPKFPQNPCRYAHALTTPEEPDGTRLHVPPTRPRVRERPRLLRLDSFEAQSHGLTTRCLRFTVAVARHDARLACGCRLSSAARDSIKTRRVLQRGFSYVAFTSRPPLASLLGAIPVSFPLN
jgi:hypothetical protein